MQRVLQAQVYRPNALGSFGNAEYMLIRQHKFPDEYDPALDKMVGWDHDRVMQQQHEHGRRCFKEHTGSGELHLDSWVEGATPKKVLDFLQDILKADPKVTWTGFRVLGTIHRGNGYPVWTLQLFAKHPDSKTVVHNGQDRYVAIRIHG